MNRKVKPPEPSEADIQRAIVAPSQNRSKKLIDLTGQRYGRLVVIARAENLNGATRWVCRCDCGVETIVRAGNLRGGQSRSCACLSHERTRQLNRTHGASRSRTYTLWIAMKMRCENPKNEGYVFYGARGITVCERWRESYENFLLDMGEAPTGLSLDRIDPNGNYEPTNCRWATATEQANNKTNNHRVTAFGETRTLMEWSRKVGFTERVIRMRLRSGWSAEDALSTPIFHARSRDGRGRYGNER